MSVEHTVAGHRGDAAADEPLNAARSSFSLPRRELLLGLSSLAMGAALAGCGGGGGGGDAAAEEGDPEGGGLPPTIGSQSAPGFTTTDQNRFGYLSDTASRDHEITTWTTNGRVYLRITPSGRALYFEVNGSSLRIGIALGLTETTYHPADYRLLMTGSMPASASATPTFTFGVSGFDIYAKLDGVEFLRFQDFHHMDAGRVGVKQPNGASFADINVVHYANRQLFSNLETQTYDARDFGFRSVRTTGSIATGSTMLTLQNPADIRVGDWVIVEIGQEPGGGQRGTLGVGGTWPSISYANGAEMSADVSRPNETFAWRRDTGDVYRWNGSAWVQQVKYYIAKAIPRSLHARVVSKSSNGLQLTLDRPASVSVSGAYVHLDVVPIINFLTQHIWYKFGDRGELQSLIPAERTIQLPPGDFPICGNILLNRGLGMRNALKGAGRELTKLRAPKGVACATIFSHEVANPSARTMVSDLHLIGNIRDEGYGLNWRDSVVPYGGGSGGMEWDLTSATTPASDTNISEAYAYGIFTSRSQNVDVRDVYVSDVYMAGVGAQYSTNCNAYNATVRTDGLQTYIQWMIQWSDCNGGQIVDCAVESTQLIEGMETFRSVGVKFIRPRLVNASFASNTSGDFLVEDADVVIQTMSQAPGQSFSQNNPVFNINSHLGNPSSLQLGGRLVNCRVVQEGYINSSNDSLTVIEIAAGCPNVQVLGGHFTAPDFMPGSSRHGSVGVGSQGQNTTVDGVTVIGKSRYDVTGSGPRNINIVSGTVTNCTCNSISGP